MVCVPVCGVWGVCVCVCPVLDKRSQLLPWRSISGPGILSLAPVISGSLPLAGGFPSFLSACANRGHPPTRKHRAEGFPINSPPWGPLQCNCWEMPCGTGADVCLGHVLAGDFWDRPSYGDHMERQHPLEMRHRGEQNTVSVAKPSEAQERAGDEEEASQTRRCPCDPPSPA